MDAPGTDFKPSSNGTKPLLVAVAILAIFVAGSAAYLWFTGGFGDLFGSTRSKATSKVAQSNQVSSPETEAAAFRLARQIVNDYSDSKLLGDSNLKKDEIVHVFRGQLTAIDPGKSWTVENDGKKVALHSAFDVPVKYTRSGQNINPSELKVGDSVTIRAAIDLDKGVLYVKSINIRVQQSSVQTPTPSPQQAQ
ncbi:hypothetical protein HYZ78_00295 [Candidatus Microgenomates bacterium]|nr:hypothetical protein [Candidatus Microgenomates bacterium]